MDLPYSIPILKTGLIILLSLPPAVFLIRKKKALWSILPLAANTLIAFTCLDQKAENFITLTGFLTTGIFASAIAGLGTYHGSRKLLEKTKNRKIREAIPIILFFPTLVFYTLAWLITYAEIAEKEREAEPHSHNFNGLPCW